MREQIAAAGAQDPKQLASLMRKQIAAAQARNRSQAVAVLDPAAGPPPKKLKGAAGGKNSRSSCPAAPTAPAGAAAPPQGHSPAGARSEGLTPAAAAAPTPQGLSAEGGSWKKAVVLDGKDMIFSIGRSHNGFRVLKRCDKQEQQMVQVLWNRFPTREAAMEVTRVLGEAAALGASKEDLTTKRQTFYDAATPAPAVPEPATAPPARQHPGMPENGKLVYCGASISLQANKWRASIPKAVSAKSKAQEITRSFPATDKDKQQAAFDALLSGIDGLLASA